MRNLSLLILTFILSNSLGYAISIPVAQKNQYEVVKDLNREWITVDENNRYVPYINQDMADVPVVGLLLNLSRYSGNQLLICVPSNSTVLVEKKISSYQEEASCVTLSIDSLRQLHKAEVFISVYQPRKDFDNVGLWVVQPRFNQEQVGGNRIWGRSTTLLDDFFTVGILIMLILYAVVINHYPKIFRNLYSFTNVFSFKVREDNSRVRLINEAHIVFLIQHCLLLGFLFIIFIFTTDLIHFELPYFNFQPKSFGDYVLLWGQLSLLIFLVIWVKYIMIMLFGTLFRLRQLRYLHMLDYMRMSLIYGAVLFVLLIVVFAGIGDHQSRYFNLLVYLFILLSVLRVIILYFRLFRSASFRNMYLISYLCVAEVIPLIIGFEVLVI